MEDLINTAVSLLSAKIYQKANIAVFKAQNEMTKEIINMLSDSPKVTVSASSKGRHVDRSV